MNQNNLRGNELLRAAINQILAQPETWNQQSWHCGTKHCFGGWCQVKAGEKESDHLVKSDLIKNAGLPAEDVDWLCSGLRTLSELHAYVKARLAGATDPLADFYARNGYARDGYDRDGYARDGYARDGYARDGYDRDGYARDGYDRDGYARDGYARDGYDRDGYARNGYARDGYARDGYDRDGYNRNGYDRAKNRLQPL